MPRYQNNPNYHDSEESGQYSKNKGVTFSKTSTMFCYHDDTADIHYSESDYFRFKQDALKTANRIRNSIKARQDDDAETTKVMRFIKSWKNLPCLLEEHKISHEEVLGIEHWVIGKEMIGVRVAIRNSYVDVLLDEQCRQVNDFGYYDPLMIADTARRLSNISSSIAYSRANMFRIE